MLLESVWHSGIESIGDIQFNESLINRVEGSRDCCAQSTVLGYAPPSLTVNKSEHGAITLATLRSCCLLLRVYVYIVY